MSLKASVEMIWEVPPAPERRRRGPQPGVTYQNRAEWVSELKKKRGQWARWSGYCLRGAQLAAELRRDFPGVEAITRMNKVWARWGGS